MLPRLSPDICSGFNDLERLTTRFVEYPRAMEDFLDKFLPCPVACPSPKSDSGETSGLGKPEFDGDAATSEEEIAVSRLSSMLY